MKICLVSTQLGMGGAENQVCNLADQFYLSGCTVRIVSMLGMPIVRPANQEVEVINLNMNKRKPLSVLIGTIKFVRFIKQYEPDIVHSHAVHANIFTRLMRMVLKYPRLISTAHNTNEGGRTLMAIYRVTDKLADITTNVSQEAVSAFLNKKASRPGRIITFYNGIDLEKFSYNPVKAREVRMSLGVSSTERFILAAGRLTEAKDYPNLLNAISALIKRGLVEGKIKLYIVGEGRLLNSLTDLVKELSIEKNVEFLGVRRDISELMSACDTFVLSSAWEGFGLVVAEAMACERVVVATDCGGVKEVVGDKGFLVPPGDTRALSIAIESALLLEPKQFEKLGYLARQRIAEKYSIQTISQEWLKLYNSRQIDLWGKDGD